MSKNKKTMNSTQDNIAKFGWESVYVFDEKEQRQPFLYSIGLEKTYNHPEVILFGLPRETMHGMLSDLVAKIKDGMVFEKDQRVSGVLPAAYEVMFKEVDERYFSNYLGTAKRYYQRPFRAWAMLWPDKNNKLPIQADCKLDV